MVEFHLGLRLFQNPITRPLSSNRMMPSPEASLLKTGTAAMVTSALDLSCVAIMSWKFIR